MGTLGIDSNVEASIRAQLKEYVESAMNQDWNRYCNVFDSEPVCMPPGSPALSRAADIRAFYEQFPPVESLELEPHGFEKAGPLVIEHGTYAFRAAGMSDRGKYLHIWRQDHNGRWKLYRNISNSDGGA